MPGITRRATGGLALAALAGPAAAQDARGPLRLIVPQPPGGAADFIARILADGMGRDLNQTVVVENRGGANGTIAVNALKASRSDGSAVLLGGVSLFAFNPNLYSNLPYGPRDFTYVAPAVDTVLVLVANPRLGVRTLAELMDRARAQPERLTYASVGIGNSTHLAMEMITEVAGARMTHVPFTGSTPSVTSVLTGQTDCMVIPLQTVIPHIASGAMVPLAVMNSGRVATMPDVPALRETGFESLAMPGWYAIVGPAGMPEGVTDRLNAAVRATVTDPENARRFREQGLEPMTATAAEVRRAVETDGANWGAFIRRRNLRVE